MLATTNPAKRERLEWMLDGLAGLELVHAAALDVAEGDRSLADNALLKAHAYAATYALPSIASDGGLVVPALGSRWNPVLTGRRSGELLELMRGLSGPQRAATQAECVAIVDAHGSQLGLFEAMSAPRQVAESFDPRDLPAGFWLPGVLLYGPEQSRFAELTAGQRGAIDDHWLALRASVRSAVEADLSRSAERARRHPA